MRVIEKFSHPHTRTAAECSQIGCDAGIVIVLNLYRVRMNCGCVWHGCCCCCSCSSFWLIPQSRGEPSRTSSSFFWVIENDDVNDFDFVQLKTFASAKVLWQIFVIMQPSSTRRPKYKKKKKIEENSSSQISYAFVCRACKLDFK